MKAYGRLLFIYNSGDKGMYQNQKLKRPSFKVLSKIRYSHLN